MAHFAELDENNVVLRVHVVNDLDTQDENGNEVESVGIKFCEDTWGGRWIQTSYTSLIGKRVNPDTGEQIDAPAFRKNYAGPEMIYNEEHDLFMWPQPFPSWILDLDTGCWEAPVAHATDVPAGVGFEWNEETLSWDQVEVELP